MKIAFIDESGSPALPPKDTENPYYVLTAVVFEADEYFYNIEGIIEDFKIRWFGSQRHILHFREIKRKRHGKYSFLKDEQNREHFYAELKNLLSEIEFKCVCIAIHTKKLHDAYGQHATNPLLLAHNYLGERLQRDFARLAENTGKGRVFFEECSYQAVNLSKDKLIEQIQTQILDKSPNIRGYHFSLKEENLNGIQIADLCATPIRRKIGGLDPSFIPPKIVGEKLIRDPISGNLDGYGLKVFPK